MKTHAIARSTRSHCCPGSSLHRLSISLGALGLLTGLLVLSPFLCAPAHAVVTVVTNITFDELTLGSTPPETTPLADPLPQDTLYDIVGAPPGTVTVANVGGMTNAALMNTSQAGVGSLFMDTQFLIDGEFFNLSFDINVQDTPSTGLGQVGTNAPNGQAFGINVFALNAVDRLFHFGVAPGSATGGNFVFNAGGADSTAGLVVASPYVEDQTYHVEFRADFGLGSLDMSVNGTQVATDVPLVGGTGASEIFMYQNGVAGIPNMVALDNIVSSVPEPSSWIMLTLGATALLGIFRRRNLAR